MDQQRRCNKADILDFSTLQSGEATNLINNVDSWLLNENNGQLKELQGKNKGFSRAKITEEELKIRNEVEMDIERDLEEEIKAGICHLALRLHRLYQHQKERRKINKAFSEVNINIKMEGGTKIEIKETKMAATEKGCPNWTSSRSENMVPITKMGGKTQKFDWAKTLRSSPGHVPSKSTANVSGQNKRNMSADHNKFLVVGWKV